MDNLNHLKQSIPRLRAAHEFPTWKRDFTGHLAQHCLVDVLKPDFVIPPLRNGNGAATSIIEGEKALQKE